MFRGNVKRRMVGTIVLTVLALGATLVPAVRGTVAGESSAAGTSSVFGVVMAKGGRAVKVSIALFTENWTHVRAVKSTGGGIYRMNGLAPGTYHLQASERRPAWDIKRLARTDATFTVRAGQSVQRDLTMRVGSFVTGTVKVGKPAKVGRRATVRVVSQYGATFETIADTKGRFAIGGLPSGQKYSLFTWDRAKKWTSKSIYIGRLKVGQGRNVAARLRTRAAGYLGILRVNGTPTTGSIWATIVSRKTGQWWTAPIRNGDLSRFRGLYPGGYLLRLPQTKQIAAQTVAVPGVRAGRTRLVRLNARPAPVAVTPPVIVKPPTTPVPSTPSVAASASAPALLQDRARR